MRLQVRFFARAKDLAGASVREVILPEGSVVSDLRRHLVSLIPGLAPLAGTLHFSVGQDYASPQQSLAEGLDIACFPPVSGG